MQKIASSINGEEMSTKEIIFVRLDCINIPTKIEPKKVLPMSPIKTLAGSQFHKRKPNNAPIIGIKLKPLRKKANKNIKEKQDATIPSMPSMKFEKFIIESEQNMIKIINNILFMRKRSPK